MGSRKNHIALVGDGDASLIPIAKSLFQDRVAAGFTVKTKIPLNPSFLKGDFNLPPLKNGGRGDFSSPLMRQLWFMKV